MELKAYWAIVRRWIWVIAAVFGLAVSASLAGFVLIPQAISYQATVRLAVRTDPEPRTGPYYTYGEYYEYLASEYLNDDLIELVQGTTFLQSVQSRLKPSSATPPSGSIKGKKSHRVVTLTVTSGTAEGAMAIAQGVVDVLSDQTSGGKGYFNQLTAKEPIVTLVDPPTITAGPGTRSLLDLALRGTVGLAAGIALAFLLEYLDDSVRSGADAERLLGVPTLGEIPVDRGRSRPSKPVPTAAVPSA